MKEFVDERQKFGRNGILCKLDLERHHDTSTRIFLTIGEEWVLRISGVG